MGNHLSQDDVHWIEQKTGVSEKMINRAYNDFRKDLNGKEELDFELFCVKAAMFQERKRTDLTKDEEEQYAHLFRAFDRDGNGSISFREFFLGLIVIGRNGVLDKEESLRLVFRLYDIDRKKEISMKDASTIWNMFNIYETMKDKERDSIDEETFVSKSLIRLKTIEVQQNHGTTIK